MRMSAEPEPWRARRVAVADPSQYDWLLRKTVDPRYGRQPRARASVDWTSSGETGAWPLRDAVGLDLFHDVLDDQLDVLGTSAAAYESDGRRIAAVRACGWCRELDRASRESCSAADDGEAARSGRWHCHESSWTDASRVCVESGLMVDVQCRGGLRIFAAPLCAGGRVLGSVNIAYGDPPRDRAKLDQIATRYGIPPGAVAALAEGHESLPPFLVAAAKNRLLTTARLLGVIVEQKRAAEVHADVSLDFAHATAIAGEQARDLDAREGSRRRKGNP